jgi:Mrp family chromosome partitioning ATPase
MALLAHLGPDAIAIGTAARHPSARAFNRLRNEVVAALGPRDRTVLISGASPGPAATLVAANLAAALARADNEVILVSASVPELGAETVTMAQLFDVADIPGLTDVLTGRTSLSRAIQRAARSPRLRLVTPGGTASATGLLQSEGTRGVIAALARQARYVVIEAPSTASGADAQSLASVADAAVLVVEAGRARHAQVADGMTQLLRVGTRLLGAVVVPRLKPDDVAVAQGPGQRAAPPEYETEDWISTNPAGPLEAPTGKFTTLPPAPSPASPTP